MFEALEKIHRDKVRALRRLAAAAWHRAVGLRRTLVVSLLLTWTALLLATDEPRWFLGGQLRNRHRAARHAQDDCGCAAAAAAAAAGCRVVGLGDLDSAVAAMCVYPASPGSGPLSLTARPRPPTPPTPSSQCTRRPARSPATSPPTLTTSSACRRAPGAWPPATPTSCPWCVGGGWGGWGGCWAG